MIIEPTISVGNILSAGTAVITVIVAAWRISYQIKEMEWKMNMIWKWYAKEHNIENGKAHK
jgi:hypothetical protein